MPYNPDDNAGLKNAYVCENLHTTVTVNIETGKTPYQIPCPECSLPARTMNFQVDQELSAGYEFYRMTESEAIGEDPTNPTLKGYDLAWWQSGGLTFRENPGVVPPAVTFNPATPTTMYMDAGQMAKMNLLLTEVVTANDTPETGNFLTENGVAFLNELQMKFASDTAELIPESQYNDIVTEVTEPVTPD